MKISEATYPLWLKDCECMEKLHLQIVKWKQNTKEQGQIGQRKILQCK